MKTITIGRSSHCDIVIADERVSRVHAEITLVDNKYVYKDVSKNGSNIGGRIILNEKVVIAPGATVLLSNHIPLPWAQIYALLPIRGAHPYEQETKVGSNTLIVEHIPVSSSQEYRSYKKDELEMKNDAYNKFIELKNNESIDKKRVSNIKDQQLSILSSKINIEMNRLNNIIYKEENNVPILSFSKKNYSFATPENTGTGIAYKGLVIFDISVLNLTNLPIIVHDSFVLKQISDKAFEKILELYIKSEKQVIIVIDKKNSYTDETQKILDESVILNLGSNGNELFGKSWG